MGISRRTAAYHARTRRTPFGPAPAARLRNANIQEKQVEPQFCQILSSTSIAEFVDIPTGNESHMLFLHRGQTNQVIKQNAAMQPLANACAHLEPRADLTDQRRRSGAPTHLCPICSLTTTIKAFDGCASATSSTRNRSSPATRGVSARRFKRRIRLTLHEAYRCFPLRLC